MKTSAVSQLSSFGQLVEFQAARSLDLMRAIDDAIYACNAQRDMLKDLTGKAHELIQVLRRCNGSLDPNRDIQANLERGRDALEEVYKVFAQKRASAASDPKLTQEDGVVEAFDHLLDATAAAQNAINDLAWHLGEHEADLDGTADGVFTSADDLIKALRS